MESNLGTTPVPTSSCNELNNKPEEAERVINNKRKLEDIDNPVSLTSTTPSPSPYQTMNKESYTLKKIPFRRQFTPAFVNKLMAPFAGVKLNETNTIRMDEIKELSKLALQTIAASLKKLSAADDLRIKHLRDGTIDQETNLAIWIELMRASEKFKESQSNLKTAMKAQIKRLTL